QTPVGDDHLGAAPLECATPLHQIGGGLTGDDNDRPSVGCREHARAGRRTKSAVEDRSHERSLAVDTAGGEQGVVNEYRTDTHSDGVPLGSYAVRVPVRRLPCQQGATARRLSEVTIEAHGSLQGHKWPAGFEQGEERLVLPARVHPTD